MDSILQEFRNEIDDFLRQTGMAESVFGKLAVNDKSFVSRLRAGRDVKVSTMHKVHAWMRAQPSPDAKSPSKRR